MEKSETSTSWFQFLKELQEKCQEQKISGIELAQWIRISIDQIEKKTFDYHISSGEVKEYPDQKIDISILLSDFFYSFTVFQNKRVFNIYSAKSFQVFTEEIFEDYIRHNYYITESTSFYIEDKISNSARLRKFTRKVLSASWGM
jgi:hypothetical protein